MNKRILLEIIACSGFFLGSAHISEVQGQSDQRIVQGLQHDNNWLNTVIDEMIAEGRGDTLDEPTYFGRLAQHLMFANNYIVIRGYDARFMEFRLQNMIEMLSVPVMRNVSIYALVPDGVDTTLDRLYREFLNDPHYSEKAKNIVIMRVPERFDKGYVLVGDWLVGVWDSTKPPVHPDNVGTGAYLRAFTVDYNLNNLLGRSFLVETRQDSVYTNAPHSQGEPLFPKLEYFK